MDSTNITAVQYQALDTAFVDALERIDIDLFSIAVFGKSYKDIQDVIYPAPPYRTFYKDKRSGGIRTIREPHKRLKILQGQLLIYLKNIAGLPKPCAHAFIEKRSIVTNARKHIERKPTYLLNLDLEDFFPSISFYRVRGLFKNRPFNFSHQVATVAAQICVIDNELPQGAATSPFLSNQICRSLDRDLMDLARRHQATYTRYADDITFSFSRTKAAALPTNICSFENGKVTLGNELLLAIQSHNFKVNPSKTRMTSNRRRMEVTGITINEFPNVKRDFINRVRGALHAWDRHGYENAQQKWALMAMEGGKLEYGKRPWKRQTRTGAFPELRNVLWGKLLYIRMVRGADDTIYTRLAEKYNRLIATQGDRGFEKTGLSLPVEHIVRNMKDVEEAVFVLEWEGLLCDPETKKTDFIMSQGTAFAYRHANRLVTCDHVLVGASELPSHEDGVDIQNANLADVKLTVHNPALNAVWPVRIVYRDASRDVAILEFADSPPANRYFSGVDSPIHRHGNGRLIGFPNWSRGRRANIEQAVVTARFPRSALQRFEISQLIRKGNSGGPFVDESFRVAGIAQKGATQADGNNECLCILEFDAWFTENSNPSLAKK